MDTIEIKTLIDITKTSVIRLNRGTPMELDQNRNFVTLAQCAEIRSIISYDEPPTVEKVDIKNLGFGSAYRGQHSVWTFTFTPDRANVYSDDPTDPLAGLISDINEVPVIKNLTETINIDKAIFELRDSKYRNTTVKIIPGTL